MTEKNTLRKVMQKLTAEIDDRIVKDYFIIKRLHTFFDWLSINKSDLIHSFIPMADEPDFSDFLKNREFLIPKVIDLQARKMKHVFTPLKI